MLPEILKTAMIGTEKTLPTANTALLKEIEAQIAASREDKEDAFLKLTAAYLLLQEAGRQVPVIDHQHPAVPQEHKQYIAAEATSLLNQLVKTKESILLEYALYRCTAKEKVVRPDLVPALLSLASATKENSHYLKACGERGRWLARLNDSWKSLYAPAEEDIWETGTLPQRKEYLTALRKRNPQKARELLEETITKESANTRAELLEILQIGLSPEDEPFLESQLKDKSSKVKQAAYSLLKLLPHSSISRQYQEFLKQALLLKEERVMLLAKKKVLEIAQQLSYPEHLTESGFEKVSSLKGVEDEIYWVAQAIQYAHPRIWEESYGLNPEQTVQLMAAHKQKKLLLTALTQAALLHQHQEIAKALLGSNLNPDPQLLQVLEMKDRHAYAGQFTDDRNTAAQLLPLLMDSAYTPMPSDLCRQLIKLFSREPYAVAQSMYHKWALYMPALLLPELQDWARREVIEYQQRFFKNVAIEMSRIIETKEQLNASI